MPLLSIVIPTRNRPDLLTNALASVLDQERVDLEVVISDNSDETCAKKNKDFIDGLRNPIVRYVKPSSVLPMVNHWEWAVEHANGTYVGILTDRMMFKKGALRRIGEIVQLREPGLLAYGFDYLSGATSPYRYVKGSESGNISETRAVDIFKSCQRGESSILWPRMMNCVCKNVVLEDLRTNYGGVFSGVAPDYSFCYRVMDWLGGCLTLNSALIISAGSRVSNGASFLGNTDAATSQDFVKLTGTIRSSHNRQILENVLIPWTAPVSGNIEILEYLIAREKQVSGLLEPIDYSAYYRVQFRQLLLIRIRGGNTDAADQALEVYRRRYKLKVSKAWLKLRYFTGYVARVLRNRMKRLFGFSNQLDEFSTEWDARESNPIANYE